MIDLAYVIAKEELPFSKYPAIAELEKFTSWHCSGKYVLN